MRIDRDFSSLIIGVIQIEVCILDITPSASSYIFRKVIDHIFPVHNHIAVFNIGKCTSYRAVSKFAV